MWIEIARSFQQGDVYIYFMLGMGFIGTVVFFERLIMLQFVFNINFPKFLNNLKKMVRAEDLDRAMNLCKSASRTSLPMISLRALEAAESDPTSVRGTIEEEAIDFLPRIETRLGVLPACATIALMIGIMGTIDALWGTFHSIDVLDTAQKQASIGHNIAGSLSYTTMGLVFCMMFLVGHQILRGMAIRMTEKIHYGVTVLTNLLAPQDFAMMPLTVAPAGGVPVNMGQVPVADAAAPVSAEPIPVAPPQAVAEEKASGDEFDDASVEDIKDEEEII